MAKKDSNAASEAGMAAKTSTRGSTRRERAAKVSEELQILQRDASSPSAVVSTPGAAQPMNPEMDGDLAASKQEATGRAMGDNDGSTQEGLHAQGVNVSARTDVSSSADTRAARSTGQPVTVDNPSESSGSGMERGLGMSGGKRLAEASRDINADSQDQLHLAFVRKEVATATRTPLSREVLDRLSSLSEAGLSTSEPRPAELAKRLMRKQFIRVNSEEELAAVLEEAKRAQKAGPGYLPASPKVSTISRRTQRKMIDTMVAGEYDKEGLSEGEKPHKHTVLNEIARATTLNGSYLREDGQRVLAKVRGLLPASMAASKPQPKIG